jgi:hypothetical protein
MQMPWKFGFFAAGNRAFCFFSEHRSSFSRQLKGPTITGTVAANVLPIIRDIQAAGHTSLNAIAGQLNARKVATANGGQWRGATDFESSVATKTMNPSITHYLRAPSIPPRQSLN